MHQSDPPKKWKNWEHDMAGPALSKKEMEAWRTFLRAHDHVIRSLDEDLRGCHDLTISEYDVLVQLAQANGRRLRMRDLAVATLFSPSGLTRLCERLEARGLVTRESSAGDLRGTDAVLTAEGVARLREARPTHLDGVRERFVARLSATELEAFAVVLRRLCE